MEMNAEQCNQGRELREAKAPALRILLTEDVSGLLIGTWLFGTAKTS